MPLLMLCDFCNSAGVRFPINVEFNIFINEIEKSVPFFVAIDKKNSKDVIVSETTSM